MEIVGANGEVLKKVEVEKDVLAGNKTISKEEAVAKEKELQAKQEEVNSRPLLASEDMKVTPNGSMMIARGFVKPKSSIILAGEGRDSIVPCLQIMKIGPNVKNVSEGQWVMLRDQSASVVVNSMFPYKNELFYFLQEHDVMFIYDEQPDLDELINTGTTVVRDLTEYVKFEKLSKVRAKITEV